MNQAVRTSSTSSAARPQPQVQPHPRRRRRLVRVAAASLALGAGLALLLDYARGAPPRARHQARPLEREVVDLATIGAKSSSEPS
jgi:ferric-dicitrate binding protein FerR (iron transport regulator)